MLYFVSIFYEGTHYSQWTESQRKIESGEMIKMLYSLQLGYIFESQSLKNGFLFYEEKGVSLMWYYHRVLLG